MSIKPYNYSFSHPFKNDLATNRLLEEYEKYGKLYVAFDFDNTIFDYHNNGGNYSEVISLLQECSKLGFIMILFTVCSDKDRLDFMKAFCKHYNIRIDFINESPLFPNSGKPYYNVLLDDRAGLESAYSQLKTVIRKIESI